MTKHYEQLWVEAEGISSKALADSDIYAKLFELLNELEYSEEEDAEEIIGDILFMITALSHKFNVNTWNALLNSTNKHRVELLEE